MQWFTRTVGPGSAGLAQALGLLLLVALVPTAGRTQEPGAAATRVQALGDAATWNAEDVGLGVVWKRQWFADLFAAPQSIEVLEIAPGRGIHFDLADAQGLERTSAMASRAGALAAINGGFFAKNGDPDGLFRADGELVSESRNGGQGALGIDAKGRVHIAMVTEPDWAGMPDALGAGPILVRKGGVVDHGERQRKIRHPRTALGLKRNGAVVWVTVAGRTEKAGGMSLQELAEVMIALGCVQAVNLDGGGSTAMWIRGRGTGGIVSHPCDNKRYDRLGERAVGNAVLLFAPAVIVVDNDGAALAPADGWERRREGQGVWGEDFDYAAAGSSRSAQQRVRLPYAGSYRVSARWPRISDAGVVALVLGDETWPIDQRLRGGKWVILGEIASSRPDELVFEWRAEAGQPLVVDAIRVVQVGASDRR